MFDILKIENLKILCRGLRLDERFVSGQGGMKGGSGRLELASKLATESKGKLKDLLEK